MRREQKILILALWLVAGMAIVSVAAIKWARLAEKQPTANPDAVVSNAGSEEESLPDLYPAPEFTLTDQHNQTITKSQLLGHPWICDFIFTTCADACPLMSTRMSALQNKLPPDVKLVSFTVDPLHDTPEVLAKYAQAYHAQDGRWLFLTGPVQTEDDVIRGMRLYFQPAQGQSVIQHSQHFVLVDAKGSVREYYDSSILGETDHLIADVQRLLNP
ncbi:MAG: SCO family protein [Tepidisphaeraceae bacterium]|jgi:protein SCO1/2